MKIIPLNEGIYAVDKKKNFVPITIGTKVPGSLRMAVCPFLIVSKDEIILLDVGLGFKKDGAPMIKAMLQQHGYKPEQVSKVLMSHLHKDHSDGLGYFEDGNFVQNFPDAKIYIQEKELEYALSEKDNPSFTQEVLEQLHELPNIEWMNEEKGAITEHIRFERTGGHSPFHQAFWITEGEETAFYGADNLPQKGYLKFHLAYKTDDDGKKAMALREIWEKEAKENHWTVLFYHDIDNNAEKF